MKAMNEGQWKASESIFKQVLGKRILIAAAIGLALGGNNGLAQQAATDSPVLPTTTAKPAAPAGTASTTTSKPAAGSLDTTGAKKDSSSVALSTVVVQGASLDQTILPVAPTSSIYGLSTSIQDTPRTISELTPDLFTKANLKSVDDLIYYAPSVTKSAGGLASGTTQIRNGPGAIYVNGILSGLSNHEILPFSFNAYQSADIVSGPAVSVFGPSPYTSGYVNYITKQPFFDGYHGAVTLDFGKWDSGGQGGHPDFSQTVDYGGPLIPNELAFRASFEKQEAGSYYQNTNDDYDHGFAALTWLPTKDLTVEWNAQFGSYEYEETSGTNRTTQDFIDNQSYQAGQAIPIVQQGSGAGATYFSPVLNSNGTPTGTYVSRIYNPTTSTFTAGAPVVPNTTKVGTIVADVLAPGPTQKVYGYQTVGNSNSPSHGVDFNTQVKTSYHYDDDFNIVNTDSFEYLHSIKDYYQNFYQWLDSYYGENRTEFQLKEHYDILGLNIDHDSDSGVDIRVENVNWNWTTGNVQNSAYNIAGGQGQNINELYGDTTIINSSGSGVVATPAGGYFGGVPLSTKVTYLYNGIPAANGNVFQAEDVQTGLFSQHNIKFDEQWALNVGGRVDLYSAEAYNPFNNQADNSEFVLPSINSSLSFKPIPQVTTYLSFDYSQAYNGGAGPGFLQLTGNGTLNPANYHSDSLLYEAGAKAEIIPNQLFATVAGYYQERAKFDTITNTSYPFEIHGVDASLRYQPNKNFSAGLNLTWEQAHYDNFNPASGTDDGHGVVDDNATAFAFSGTSNGGYPRAGYRVPFTPTYLGSAFAEYKFDWGLGFNAKLWAESAQNIDYTGQVKIRPQYNLDLGTFFEKPTWRVEVDFLNVTDTRTFESLYSGTVDNIVEGEPFGIQGRFTYKF